MAYFEINQEKQLLFLAKYLFKGEHVFKKILFAITTLFLLLGCSQEQEIKKPSQAIKEQNTDVGKMLTLQDVDTNLRYTIKRTPKGLVVEGHEDKVVLIDIFATYCPPCRAEAKDLALLQKKYQNELLIIGLNSFEEVSDTYVSKEFKQAFGADYFISNSYANMTLVDTILSDIKYQRSVSIPFKVVLKNGVYQNLTDIFYAKEDNKFYIGRISPKLMEEDLKRILN